MKATNKDKAQKMISAKIAAKLVELANKYVVPCININIPGRYSASQLYDEKDALGNKLYWSIDADKCNVSQIEVTITESDFNEKELEELGYSPKFKLSIQNLMVFRAIAKYEQLAGLRSANRAKFVVGEPATIYETERAKVVIYDNEKQKIVTKTKTLTIISDSLAIYLHKKYFYAFCLKINGKWINVYKDLIYYDIEETAERAKKEITYESVKSRAEKSTSSYSDAYADYCRLILSELDEMDKLNAEEAKTQAADNVVADIESNANVATENASNEAETADNTSNDKADEPKEKQQHTDADAPPKDSGTPRNQCGRKSAVLSDFRGKGDKVYRQSGENRNSGVYCGNSGVSQETQRGSPAKQASTI